MAKLNLDIPQRVAEFETLINEILPKKIFYRNVLRGRGLEFDGYREFTSDEDASSIDWRVSMRTGSLMSKKYNEERKVNVNFILDVGENMVFGSQEKLKCEIAAEIAASLAHVFMNTGGKIGLSLFGKKDIHVNLPNPGREQFAVFVSKISDSGIYGGQKDLDLFFKNLLKHLYPVPDLIIFISDFIYVHKAHLINFRELASLAETVAIIVKDPLDKTLPDLNREIIIEDMATNQRMLVNPEIARKIYERKAFEQTNLVRNIFKQSNIDFIELGTEEPFVLKLARFFKIRTQTRRPSR
jgi:uncharacterized protein (DUF58 family)